MLECNYHIFLPNYLISKDKKHISLINQHLTALATISSNQISHCTR